MLLTITTTRRPAAGLGCLPHKHPAKVQSFDLGFGRVHVFYPRADADRCPAGLLLDVDAVGTVRGESPDQGVLLGQIVNDRPSAASSFHSVAVAQVFGSKLHGKCRDRPELVAEKLRRDAAGARRRAGVPGEVGLLEYKPVAAPDWGDSPHFAVTIRMRTTVGERLTHPSRSGFLHFRVILSAGLTPRGPDGCDWPTATRVTPGRRRVDRDDFRRLGTRKRMLDLTAPL